MEIVRKLKSDSEIVEMWRIMREEMNMLPPPYDIWGHDGIGDYKNHLRECIKQNKIVPWTTRD